jgi:hypothetical protein
MAKFFRDAYGRSYSLLAVYYQPQDPKDPDSAPCDKHHKSYPSYAVWLDFHTCRNLFPGCHILAYSGDDIQEPMFIDERG